MNGDRELFSHIQLIIQTVKEQTPTSGSTAIPEELQEEGRIPS